MAKEEKIVWDVKIGDKIEFFDPDLSYEISGYRPLTMTKGLDFDKTPFIEVGRRKDETGRYTTLPIGSKTHREFWKTQHERSLKGYTVNGYRITGDHYFFVNFYRLPNVENVTQAGSGRAETMASFWAKHYEYFHYVDICEKLGYDVIALKARGVGFSEIAASMGVCKYTCQPNYKSMYTAYAEGYLLGDGVLAKVWNNLEYLNQETETGMLRLRGKIDTIFHKRASKVDDQKNESGHMSEILGKTVDNPRKLRGGRYDRIFYEEFGSDAISVTKWNQSEALVKILGKKIGTRFGWGTGGDSGPYLAGLEKMFLDPKAFGGLPYRHKHTKNGEYMLSGYFVPAYACVMQFMDHRGVTDEEAARSYYMNERAKKVNDPQNLIEFCSEYCFYPEEALSRQGQNDFNQVYLAEQHTRLTITKEVEPAKSYDLFWRYDADGKINGVDARLNTNGTGEVLISELPLLDETTNKPMKNLYVGGIDGIDVGTEDSVVGEDGSKFAIVIKKRTFGNNGNRYVCFYKKRPDDVRKAYATAAKILMLYGCKANMEDSKLGFRTWLREKKLDKIMLMNRPSYALKEGKARSETLWGTPASPKMINHALELIRDFIEDYWQTLDVVELVEEFQRYSYDAKGKFDYVAAVGMAEIGDEDMYALKIEENKVDPYAQWQDIGYYRDERGIKRFGVIPKKNNDLTQFGHSYGTIRT